TAEYERHIAHHQLAHESWVRDANQRIAWTKKVEADWQERTNWATQLERERAEAIAEFEKAKVAETEAWEAVSSLSKQLDQASSELERLKSTFWPRLGRKLRAID